MISSGTIYQLEKKTWTEVDFEKMGWHDVYIHAVTFAPEAHEFILDIDYIFAWVEPEPPSPYYSFWISPATLVFRNVTNFQAEIGDPLGLQIMGITRSNPHEPMNAKYIDDKTTWAWSIDLLQGGIGFESTGYTQFTRREPARISSAQKLSSQERGGISFEQPLS